MSEPWMMQIELGALAGHWLAVWDVLFLGSMNPWIPSKWRRSVKATMDHIEAVFDAAGLMGPEGFGQRREYLGSGGITRRPGPGALN